ncbi:MAG: hypothetical protein AABY22_01910 [Nanoarchaeota archaeon]
MKKLLLIILLLVYSCTTLKERHRFVDFVTHPQPNGDTTFSYRCIHCDTVIYYTLKHNQ